MAEKRMFTKKITDADEFVSLPSSAQALYLHLNQSADDDGFNNQVQLAMFKAHASSDDVKMLLAKRFIIQFESGVIVIKHWRMANALRKDRYTPTAFQEEFKLLKIKDNGSYTFKDDLVEIEVGLPNGCQVVAVDKNSIDKNSKDKDILSETAKEIIGYLNEKCGTNYRYSSTKTQGLIKARLNEHFTVNDFKRVIDIKCDDWGKDPRMQMYLRPETLFGTKFEGYLNQKGATNGKGMERHLEQDSLSSEQLTAMRDDGEDEFVSDLFG